MKIWVKIPEKPNGKSIITCLYSLINALHNAGHENAVTGVRINKQERTIEFEVENTTGG